MAFTVLNYEGYLPSAAFLYHRVLIHHGSYTCRAQKLATTRSQRCVAMRPDGGLLVPDAGVSHPIWRARTPTEVTSLRRCSPFGGRGWMRARALGKMAPKMLSRYRVVCTVH